MAAPGRSYRTGYMANELYACAWYRCVVPGVALMKHGDEVELNDDLQRMADNPPDIFVNQAWLHPEVLRFAQYLNARDGITVFDLDDEPFAVPPENPASGFWMHPESQRLLIEIMRSVKVLTTTTPELAERFERFNANVHVLRNMLPADMWPTERKCIEDEPRITIGWAGGASHQPDIRMVEDVIHQILDRYEYVDFRFAGGNPAWFNRVHERFDFVDPVSIQDYPALLSSFDIAIAPLVENRFNEGKSDLKPLEYAMVGLPVIASKSPSYSRSIKHGENGLLVRSHKDWINALRTLIEDIELRDRMAASARAWAETRLIDDHIGKWEAVYGIER